MLTIDNLFDDRAGDLPVAPPEREIRRPQPLPDDGSPSPFGTTMPENLPPAVSTSGLTRVSTKGTKASPIRDHYPRVIARCEKEFGGFFYTCDSKKIAGGGTRLVPVDLLGFMDIQGVTGGQIIGVNVTSKEKIGAHLRDYTDPRKTVGPATKPIPVETLLRRFLNEGGVVFIYGYHKPNGRNWDYEQVEVTPELLDEYKARKRGPRVGGKR